MLCPSGCTTARTAVKATAIVLVACDMGQTLSQATSGYGNNHHEVNPVLGDYPSAGYVSAYFVTAIAMLVGLDKVLPDQYSVPINTTLVGVESYWIVRNTSGVNKPFCGL